MRLLGNSREPKIMQPLSAPLRRNHGVQRDIPHCHIFSEVIDVAQDHVMICEIAVEAEGKPTDLRCTDFPFGLPPKLDRSLVYAPKRLS